MSEVRLIPLGVGDAFSARNYTTCLALGVDDAWLLIECPHPIRKMLREASTAAGLPFDLDRVDAVAVSHLHADHCSGLEDFGYYTYFVLGRRARVAMHPEVSARLWDGLLAAGMAEVQMEPDGPTIQKQLDDYFELIPLSESAPVSVGPVRDRVPADHPPDPDDGLPHPGRRPDPRLQRRHGVRPHADRLARRRRPDRPRGDVGLGHSAVHTPYEKLAALPAALRDRMRLIHYPDDFDLAASVIEPLRQGRSYAV